jgi:hypothetical protein
MSRGIRYLIRMMILARWSDFGGYQLRERYVRAAKGDMVEVLTVDQYALYRPATRQEDRSFRYQALSFRSFGPFHPIQGKVAAIGVTRGGTVRSLSVLVRALLILKESGKNVVPRCTGPLPRSHGRNRGLLITG